jgi:tetratricopeptide (TPR) repeat protein
VQVLKDHVANEPHTRWECRSSPCFQHTALYPLTDFFQRALRWQPADTPDEKLAKLEQQLRQYRLPVAETVPLFAPFLSLPLPEEQYSPLALSPQRQRQKTLETIVAILLELAERQPLLFVVEDLHWTDPTTLELLLLLLEQTPTASLYILLTCRPEFQPPWSHRSYLTEVTVTRLSREQITRMAVQIVGGTPLPAEVLQRGPAHPEVEHLYTQAYTVCQAVGEPHQLSFILWGLWRFYSMRALQPAHDVAERLLALATQLHDQMYLLAAHGWLGLLFSLQGALQAARAHFEQALACYDAQQARSYIARYGVDPGVNTCSHHATVLWSLGYPAQAREQLHQALTIAHTLAHPYSLVRAHLSAVLLYQACREVPAAQASTEAALRLCQEHGYAFYAAQAEQAYGWVLAMQGQVEAGLAYLSRSLDAWRATGAKVWQVQWLLLCAEVYRTQGQRTAGLQMVSDALRYVDETGEE